MRYLLSIALSRSIASNLPPKKNYTLQDSVCQGLVGGICDIVNLMDVPKLHSKGVRLFFFWSGITATFCYRAIVVLNNYSQVWAQILWYVGTVGFIVYFAHRFQISEKRAKIIKEQNLAQKIRDLEGLTMEEKGSMEYIFATLQSSKEKWNYIFIFVSSFVALILGVYLDFIRR